MKDRWILSMKDLAVLLVCILFFGGTLGLAGITGREHAKRVVCMANLDGLSSAWLMYTQDNDGVLASGNTYNYSSSAAMWVQPPYSLEPAFTGHDSTVDEKINGIKVGGLYPYTGHPAMYHCPSDRRYQVPVRTRGVGGYRSYSISGAMNGIPTGMLVIIGGQMYSPVQRYSDIVSPSDKYVFMEENLTHSPGLSAGDPPDMGFNINGWLLGGYDNVVTWRDPVATWHDDGMNLVFADGHVSYRRWLDQRTVWFANDWMDPRLGSTWDECATQLDNPDIDYMLQHSGFPVE